MFGTIRRHQTWLWVIIGGLTIISFAVFGPTNSKMGNVFQGGDGNFGTLAGHHITRDQFSSAVREVQLDYFLKNQQWPNTDSIELRRDAYMRLFLIQKMKDLGVRVSTEAEGDLARRIISGFGLSSLNEFADKVLRPVSMDSADFDSFLRHTMGIQQLVATAGVSGRLVTPQEAETMYKLEHQDIDTRLVYFSATNYMAKVPVVAEAVAQFYTNQLANYRLAERVQVDYVKFNVTNYLAAAQTNITNLDSMVASTVDRLGTNLFHDAKTPEESKAAIRTELLREHAMGDARRAAFDFANALDATKDHTLANFAAQVKAAGMSVGTTAPFDHEYGPQDITVPPSFAQHAFGLSAEDPYAGPIEATDGYYVMSFRQRFEAETPSLASIKDKVTADYRFMNAVQMAQQDAIKFNTALTNGLNAGKSFASICAQAGVKPVTLPPFSLDTRSVPEVLEDKISLNLLKQAAFSTAPGKASGLAGARDGAFLLYVEKQLPLDDAKVKAELPNFLATIRSAREYDAFNQWFRTEINQDPDFVQYIQHMMEEAQVKPGANRRKS